MTLRLGKKPAENDSRDLLFAKYLTTNLPTPLSDIYWQNDVVNQNQPTPFPMYGNDQYGDCTCAAAGHMIEVWTANTGKIVVPTEDEILSVYKILSPNDDGCTLGQVLRYWRATGFGSSKILAWAKLELRNHEQVKQAIELFGNIYLGVQLPDAVFQDASNPLAAKWYLGDQIAQGNKWTPDPNNGHCVNLLAYDEAGLGLVTWGTYKTCDWQFYDAYSDEAFVVLSQEWIDAAGIDPDGFDLAALQADLAAL